MCSQYQALSATERALAENVTELAEASETLARSSWRASGKSGSKKAEQKEMSKRRGAEAGLHPCLRSVLNTAASCPLHLNRRIMLALGDMQRSWALPLAEQRKGAQSAILKMPILPCRSYLFVS